MKDYSVKIFFNRGEYDPVLIEELFGFRPKFVRRLNKMLISNVLLTEIDLIGKTPQEAAEDILSAYNSVSIARDKEARIKLAKNVMNEAIYDEVFTYFDTSDREAANTWSTSWQLKAAYASDYINSNLSVIHTTTSFATPGESLTVFSDAPTNTVIDQVASENKIKAYFEELIEERVKPFDKFRDQKINDFLITKAAIETE